MTSDDDTQGTAWIEHEPGPVLYVSGDVDASTGPLLEQQVELLLADPAGERVVDLGAVRSLDVAGVGALTRLAAGDRPLVLRSVPDGIRDQLRAAGLPAPRTAPPPP